MKKLAAAFLLGCGILMAGSASAEEREFGPDFGRFIIDVPDGWNARVIENGVKNRLQEISIQVEVLEGDAANIRGALDAVNGKYKSVIIMRLIRGYSWTKISGKLGVPDSTARNWHGRAVERLGEVLEDVPMVDELAERATRART